MEIKAFKNFLSVHYWSATYLTSGIGVLARVVLRARAKSTNQAIGPASLPMGFFASLDLQLSRTGHSARGEGPF